MAIRFKINPGIVIILAFFGVFIAAEAFADQVDLTGNGIIRGVVYDESGQQMTGVLISFFSLDRELLDSVKTSANGQFVKALSPGAFYVSAWTEGYIQEYYPNSYFIDDARTVLIFPKQIAQIIIRLKVGGAITGSLSVNNMAAARITVSAYKIDDPYDGWQFDNEYAITNTGTYYLGGLIPGHYKIFARGQDYQTQYYYNAQSFEQGAVIQVAGGLIMENIDFNLHQPGSGFVAGRVVDIRTGMPLIGVPIYASQWVPNVDDPNRLMTNTDTLGNYIFEATAGDYFVMAEFAAVQMLTSGLRVYYDGRLSQDLADIISVQPARITNNINFGVDLSLNYNLRVSGFLNNEHTGIPISGAKMIAIDYATGRALASGITRSSGNFLIDNLTDGSYLIQMSGANIIPAFWPGVWGWQQAELIHLYGSSFELYNGGAITQDYGTPGLSISGNAGGPDGPLSGVRIYAVNIGNDIVAYAKSDGFGNYSISSGLTEGAYTVFADQYGYGGAYYPGIVALDLIGGSRAENINFYLEPAAVNIETANNLPQNDRLLGNYPNPFNSSTRILFNSMVGEAKNLEIFDITGRLCKTIAMQTIPGINSVYWDGRDNFGNTVASGIYLYRVSGIIQAKKMSLLK